MSDGRTPHETLVFSFFFQYKMKSRYWKKKFTRQYMESWTPFTKCPIEMWDRICEWSDCLMSTMNFNILNTTREEIQFILNYSKKSNIVDGDISQSLSSKKNCIVQRFNYNSCSSVEQSPKKMQVDSAIKSLTTLTCDWNFREISGIFKKLCNICLEFRGA